MKRSLFFIFSLLICLYCSQLFAQNNCLTFDGTGDYVNIPSEPLYTGSNITSFTQEAWIYSENTDASHHAVMGSQNTGEASGRGPSIYVYNTSTIHFGFGDGSVWHAHDVENVIEANTWTHLAVTFDGTNYCLYVNGILEYTGTDDAGSYPVRGIAYIGKLDNYFGGKIDEVRIWNDARSEAEIRQNMYGELADPSSEINLVAYYKFNETSGTTLTDAKGSHNGTLVNYESQSDYWQGSPTTPGSKNCLNFDGTDDYVSTNYTTQLDSWTVECWVKGENPPTSGFSRVIFRGENFQINWNHDTEEFRGSIALEDGADGYASGWCCASFGTLEAGTWYHLVGTYDGNNLKAYKNGELITDNGWPDGYATSTTQQLIFGSAGSDQYFEGDIDEVRIWNDVRTANEIRENMCRTLDGDEDGLVAYYRLNEASGTTAYDATANGYYGMVSSATWTNSEAFTTWLGGTSSDWSTASNWTDGVPAANDNVGIYKSNDNYDVTINGTPEVNHLLIASTASPTLSSGITVNGCLIVESDVNLNGQTVTLGSSATLIEDGGIVSGTSGSITTTRSLSNINENIAGLGATITEDGDLGSTTITRSHAAAGSQSIKRVYRITPTNSPSSATLVFHYDDSELNGLTENTLKLFKSEDGESWTEQVSSTLNTTDNTLTLVGIDAFSYWTAAPTGSDTPLPIELTEFTAEVNNGSVELAWETASETNNAAFIIYRNDKAIGSVAGVGTSSKPHHYGYIDNTVVPGIAYTYVLADVDYANKENRYESRAVTLIVSNDFIDADFVISNAYPNPFNPQTAIRYRLAADSEIDLIIFNSRGEKVATLVSGNQPAGTYTLTWNAADMPSGVYIVKAVAGDLVRTQKIALVK